MQLLPSGLVVPPGWVIAVLGASVAAVLGALYTLEPRVRSGGVLAFTPWMATGGVFHALFQMEGVPDPLAPLFAAPAVYATTFVLLGAVWAGAVSRHGSGPPEDGVDSDGDSDGDIASVVREAGVARDVGLAGTVLFLVLAGLVYRRALALTGPAPSFAWPVVGVFVTALVFAPLYYLLRSRRPTAVTTAGSAGAAAVFAHLLDGVSTTIGVDLLGTAERTPLPRHVMEFAGRLPTAPYLGRGWLFVVVKFLLATLLVVMLASYVEEEPDEGYLLFAFVTALGLGPAANNLFLFVVSGAVAG